MSERHTHVQRYDDGPYDPDRDWGSHASANLRGRSHSPDAPELSARLSAYGRVLCGDTPAPCRLCEPGYVCHFHRDEP